MTYLGKSLIKKHAISELLPFTKQYFFRKTNMFDHTFFYKLENEVSWHFTISPGTGQSFSIGGGGLSYLRVERILLKLRGIEIEEKAFYQFSTVKLLVNDKHKDILQKGVSTLEDITKICGDFKSIFIEEFLPGYEKYSNPKEVLALWDSLPSMGEKGNIFPDTHNYSKIIIMSKLTGDSDYPKRIQETRSFFVSEIEKGEDWMQPKLDILEKVIQYLEENEV